MGLINEVAQVAETINRREQEKRERENKKLLIYEYNLEITGDLQALFYNLFKKFDIETAYKKAVTEKNKNIDNLTEQIENITFCKPHQKIKYYKYRDKFDIVNDLNNSYFKILDKIHKEYKRTEKAQNADLLRDLQDFLSSTASKCESKIKCFELMQQKNNIDDIIAEITTEKQKQIFLHDNYFKILHKVKQYYNGYILEEKREIQALKEQAKIKRRDNILSLMLFNKFLDGINKML